MDDNDLWFVRFDVSVVLNLIACGNKLGIIYIFSISSTEEKSKKSTNENETESYNSTERFSTSAPVQPLIILNGMKCSTIRQLRFSSTSEYLVAVSDDGSIYSWRILLDS